MAKVKLKLDNRKNSKRKDGTSPLILFLSHKTKTRTISLGYSLKSKDWCQETLKVKNIENHKFISTKVNNQLTKARAFIISNKLESENMSIDELKNRILTEILSNESTLIYDKRKFLNQKITKTSLVNYSKLKIERLRNANKLGYIEAIKTGINSLIQFHKTNDILFSEIDKTFLKNFIAYSIGKGNKPNTISAYLRPIKTLFNEAIEDDIISADLYPFKGLKMPRVKPTKKRALRIETINAMRDLELKEKSALWDARNYFLFMFNNMGLNMIDMAKLRKGQLRDLKIEEGKIISGRLLYTRSKNQRQYSIKLTDESLKILNFYNVEQKSDGDLVFPIGFNDSPMGRRTYKKKRQRINGRLKTLGKMVGVDEEITSYYARHSWATIAKRKMIPVSVIAEGLGHSDLKTTQIYLDSFDDKTLDDANNSIVSG